MNDVITTIFEQLNSSKRKVEKADCYEMRIEIQFLERIVTRYFQKSSYAEILVDAEESNEELIEDEDDEVLEDHVKGLILMLIENMKRELTVFGLQNKDDPKIGKSITIHNQHTTNQSQTVNIELFKEIIKDSLTGKQMKELSDIVKEEKNSDRVVPKIVNKLKSFGENVASNIVASLITNPHIYTSLF